MTRNELLNSIATTKADIATTTVELQDAAAEISSLENQLLQLSAMRDGINQSLVTLRAKLASLEEQLADLPVDILLQPNRTMVLNFDFWNGNSRYSRWQEHEAWEEGKTVKVPFGLQDMSATGGGAKKPLSSLSYDLLLDGVPIATVSPVSGASGAVFTVTVTGLKHGYGILSIKGSAPDESSLDHPVYIKAGGELPKWLPVVTSSHEFVIGNADYRISWVPAEYRPTLVPLPQRTFTPFNTAVSYTKLNREHLVVSTPRRPSIAKGGELNSMQRQWYTISDAIRKVPLLPLIDGPRGQASLGFITHAMPGTATQSVDLSSPPRNNTYVTTPWSVCRISADGTVTTLAGYRHPGVNNYWEDPTNVEVVGDFGPGEPMFHELWGATWVKKTLEVDASAPPIPTEENRQPHITGPRLLVANSQGNVVQALDFSAVTHGPAKVTTWFKGLDPWDVVGPWKGKYFVSERGAHRVLQLDEAGNIERVVIQGRALSKVDFTRLVVRLAPLAEIQLEPVVGPEGLAIMDDWLYIASQAMGQVIRVDLNTGERQVVRNYSSDHNYFLKIAVSDGTFGPRHTLFITSWTVGRYGLPAAFLPDGTSWPLSTYAGASTKPRGAGGNWEETSYNGAVGVGGGRLVGGGAGDGVWELSLAKESAYNGTLYQAGKKQWRSKGYWLTHGVNGFGHYGLPLPWGETPEIDYFLTVNGHTKP